MGRYWLGLGIGGCETGIGGDKRTVSSVATTRNNYISAFSQLVPSVSYKYHLCDLLRVYVILKHHQCM